MMLAKRFVLAAIALASTSVLAADFNKAHPHQGLVKAYDGAPPAVPLSAAEKTKLSSGKAVYKTISEGKGGRGVAVFQVDAPADVVWKVINEHASYPKYIKAVKATKVYDKNGPKVYFKIYSWGIGAEYFIAHKTNNQGRWITWRLDYSKDSDLDDSVGFWKVESIDGGKRSQVYYSVDIRLRGWVPGFMKKVLVDNGLKESTTWVKKYCEKAMKE